MPFSELLGQDTAKATLVRALERGRVHHAYRFEGPDGVGKELAAFALAQSLVCERGPLACGECSSCQRAVTLAEEDPRVPKHPDVVLIQRGLYKGVIAAGESAGISIEQIRRVVLERAGYPPHEGKSLVFIVRDAEELTPQAANALLKTLEEPTSRTHFVLLTSRPQRLLDTIRSRTLPVRFGPLPDTVLRQILQARGFDPKVAPLAQGSASLALLLADAERQKEREEFVGKALEALEAKDLVTALKFAEGNRGDRRELGELLGFFAQELASRAAARVTSEPVAALALANQHRIVLAALAELEKNVQPSLALEAMMVRLREA
jgi:DNA polymerase-3 subunit delta'